MTIYAQQTEFICRTRGAELLNNWSTKKNDEIFGVKMTQVTKEKALRMSRQFRIDEQFLLKENSMHE